MRQNISDKKEIFALKLKNQRIYVKKCNQREITPMSMFQNKSSYFANEQYKNSMIIKCKKKFQ